ncbi:MAG: helix-turn-helix domain-containing protein [Ruminococcus sp.]|nr:helix-turn-helix domain-containing protein [Ruminococcus sp.]
MNHSESADRLFQAILSLKDIDECYNFFEDICTITEIRDMCQRLETAFLIDQGISYQKISEQIGVSTATISRVSRCLNYGAGGYRAVIDRMKEAEG